MSLRTMLKAFKKQVAKLDEDKINKRFNDSIRVVKKAWKKALQKTKDIIS